ncbi:hypothetical protein WMY93_001665 [Mugilogobius chulae]|uniref:Uncharacterized protein n=1 Tax=Mugilogobius chulae TaxID=88201 RepID=A0AAW0Q2I8_9GOBI
MPSQKLERLERKKKRESQKNQEEYPSQAVDEEPVMLQDQEQEAHEPMITQTLYNILKEKYELLHRDYCSLRADFSKLEEENAKLKEELHKSCISFDAVKSNGAHLLF